MSDVILKEILYSSKIRSHYMTTLYSNSNRISLNDRCSRAEINSDFQKSKADFCLFEFKLKLNKLRDRY